MSFTFPDSNKKVQFEPSKNKSESQNFNFKNLDLSLDTDASDEDRFMFDRESASRQSFSEKRKQALSPTPKMYEYRQSTRNKKNGKFKSFVDLVI